jgi:GAF domain-containing protein
VEVALDLEHGRPRSGPARQPLAAAGLAGRVIQNGQTLLVGDLAVDAARAGLPARDPAARAWLGVPLIARAIALGAVTVESRQPHKFSAADARLLESLAGQVAIALDNAHLYTALADEKQRLELLYDLSQNLTATLNSREVARRALAQLCAFLGTFKGAVYVLEPGTDHLTLIASRGLSDLPVEELDAQVTLRVGDGLAGWAAAQRTVAVAEDVRQDARWRAVPGVDDWVRASISLPLVAGDELVGVIALHNDTPRMISPEQTTFLTAASASVAVALQNARLFAAEARRALDLMLLNDITQSGVEIADFGQLARTLSDRLCELLEADAATISLWDERRQRLLPAGAGDSERESFWLGAETDDSEVTLPAAVLLAGHSLAVEDALASPHLSWRAAERLGFGSVLGLPLLAGDEKLGAAVVGFRQPHRFKREEITRGEQAASQIALALSKARLLEETRRSAEDSQAVSGILRALNAVPDVTQAFAEIAAGLKRISGADRVSLAMLDSARATFIISALDQPRAELNLGTRLPVSTTAAAPDVLAGRAHLTPDLAAERHYPSEQALLGAGFRSRVNLPLRVGPAVLGSLNLVWRRLEGYTFGNLALVEQIADALALAVEKSRLFTETRRRADELALLVEISSALRAAGASEEMLPVLLHKAAEVVGAAFYALYLFDPETHELVLRASQPPDPALVGLRQRMGEGIVGRVAAAGEIYVCADPLHDPLVQYLPGEAVYWEAMRSSITVPLRSQDQIVGVLDMGLADARDSLDREVHLLTAISEIAGNALQRASVLETLELRVAERTWELADANSKLQELDRLKDRFVSNVSHELRTPLTNLKLHLGLLAKRGAEVLPRYLPTLERETERLRRLIEDLLDLSRLQNDSTPLSRAPLQVEHVLADVLTVHAAAAEAKQQRLRHTFAPGLPAVSADQSQLMQVFTNLLGNAVAYTRPQGEITVRAFPEARVGAAGVAVTFHNNGEEIPAEDLPHIFERFYRGQTGHDSGEPGTGLGLAISKEIVDRHGGHVAVISNAAEGTTFTVWLPAA